jgi:antitoxin component YwqK of YwqJK toxin-antitoxin module
MYNYLIFIFLLCFQFAFGQEVNKIDSKGKKQGKWEKLYEGTKVYEYRGQFKDDQPVGTFSYFYPSSKKKAVVVHDEKKKRAQAILYHESGVMLAQGIYINQKKDSIWSNYGPSGKLSSKETFKAGILHGKRVVFYIPEELDDKSQRIALIENYENGIKSGEEIEYFEDGTIKTKSTYSSGVKVGKSIKNHPNGRPMIVENYVKGSLHGWCFGYSSEGKETGKRFYKKGIELTGKQLDAWLNYCKKNNIDPNKGQ